MKKTNRAPKGTWTKKNVLAKAKGYNSIKDWRDAGGSSYGKASEMGWLTEATAHMKKGRRAAWTVAELTKIAKKYGDLATLREKNRSAYDAITRRGLANTLTSHMSRKVKPNNYWTKTKVLKDARAYTTTKAWKLASTAIHTARKNGWFQEATKHMRPLVVHGKWTKTSVRKSARQFHTKKEWREKESGAYAKAQKQGWLEEMCKHMNSPKRTSPKWTKEAVMVEAQKYLTRGDFLRHSKGAADAAKRNQWYADATAHMGRTYSYGELSIYKFLLKNDIAFETQKRFNEIRDKYPLPFDFFLPQFNLVIEYHGEQHFSGKYRGKEDLINRKMKDDLKATGARKLKLNYLMISNKREIEITEALAKALRKIADRNTFSVKFPDRELTKQELNKLKTLGTWTKDDVLKDASGYTAFNDWRKSSPAHQIAWKNGWLVEARRHMDSEYEVRSRAKLIWTKEKCLSDAKKYSSRSEWKAANSSAYTSARKHGWLDIVCSHMKRIAKPSGYWTKERVFRSAKKYATRSQWMRSSESAAYDIARSNNWLDDATQHMKIAKRWVKRLNK